MSGNINFDVIGGVIIPGQEPMGLFKEAYAGAIAALSQAESHLNKAIGIYGVDQTVNYPDTSYYLPVIYSLSGDRIMTLGDCRLVIDKLKPLLKENHQCVADYLFAGEVAWYAAEIIEAVRYLPNMPEDNPLILPRTGFLGDSVIRQQGIKISDRTIPGLVLIMGRAGDGQELFATVNKLVKLGFMLFLCDEVIDQLLAEGMELKDDSIVYPLGELTRAVHFSNYVLRAGMMFGGVDAGQRDSQRDYQRRRIRAFVLYLGEQQPVKTAFCLGAINIGMPVITDQPLNSDRQIKDWFITETDLDKAIQLGMELREIKIISIELDVPIEVDPVYEGETIRKNDLAVEFGGGRTPAFELARMVETDKVEDGKVEVIGPGMDTVKTGGAMPLGIVVDVYGRKMREDFEPVLERRIHYYINYGEGLWHDGHRDAMWMRVNEDAFDLGFNLKHIGDIIYAKLKTEFAAIIDRVQVTIYSDEQSVLEMRELARSFYNRRDEQLKELRDETVGAFYSCTLCQSFAPTHVCVVSPERTGQCGAVNWLDARAASEINPNSANQSIPKEELIDEIKGQWKSVNEFVYNSSQGTVDKVNLYTAMEHPMAASSCLDCILAVVPEGNGFAVVNREYHGMNPTGMNLSAIIGMIGSGAQVPGFMGIARPYLASRKFIRADGGLGRVIWMTRDLKEQLRPLLEEAAEGIWGLGKDFVDKIADESIGLTMDEILPFLKDKEHPALTMDPII
jgi:acetyl-CoA synthase